MKPFTPASLVPALLGLASSLPAQAAPGFSKKPFPSLIITNSVNSVPVRNGDLRQVFHVRLSNNAPGTWTTALTVGKLTRFFGGDDRSVGVFLGIFDPFQGTFQWTKEANALNSTQNDRHLTLDPSGLWAIFDRDDGVWLSKRSKVGTPFPAPRKVAGFGNLRGVYPALAPVGGVMQCFYSNGKAILMQPIDLAGARLTGRPVVVSRPLQAGARPIAPTPILGADGEAEGVFLTDELVPQSGLNTGHADLVWASDLDPATPPVMLVNRKNDYACCGGLAGGFVYFSHNISPRWHIMHAEAAWMAGDVEKIGGRADLLVNAVNRNHPKAIQSVVFLALKPAPPVPIAGLNGGFALDASLQEIGVVTHSRKDGSGTLSFAIPNNPFLRGFKLATQAVVVDPHVGAATLTNTAWLDIR